MVYVDKSRYATEEGYNVKKNTLKAKFIYPLAELLSVHREHYYFGQKPMAFYANIVLAQQLGRQMQKEIQKYYPNFEEEWEDSGAFQELLYLQDKYRSEIKEYKNNVKGKKSLDTLDENSLKEFYDIFNDKSIRLNKDDYLKLKDAVKNKFIADLEALYYNLDLPIQVKKFIEKFL
jgi:hypothetical protein